MDFTINPSVRPPSTSENSVARRLSPASRLSMPRNSMPAKKHHVANVGFLGSRLAKAISRAKIAAANGKMENRVTGSSAGQVAPVLPAPQPPQQQVEGNQRQRKKNRAPPVVNGTVDHLRSNVHAEQSDNKDPEPVAQDPQRNHKRYQYDLSPAGPEKEMGREQAGDQQHPTGADPAALLRYLE